MEGLIRPGPSSTESLSTPHRDHSPEHQKRRAHKKQGSSDRFSKVQMCPLHNLAYRNGQPRFLQVFLIVTAEKQANYTHNPCQCNRDITPTSR
jgi:hypothetical protein